MLEEIEVREFEDRINAAYGSAIRWFLSARRKKGIFQYLYDSHRDEYSDKNNAIRQLMATRLLAELACEEPELMEFHKSNLEFVINNWAKQRGNRLYVVLYGKSKLGSNAMLLRSLVASPFYETAKDVAANLKNAIVGGMNSDGSMRPFFIEPNYSYDPDYLLTFYSGEALVALIELQNKSPDHVLESVIWKSQKLYIQKYVEEIESNYYPAYVPWHTMSLNMLFKSTGDRVWLDAIFALTDRLLTMLDRENQVGRFYNPSTPEYGNPHASSDGVYCEGLLYALEAALIAGEIEKATEYYKAVVLSFSHILRLQYTEENSAFLPFPDRAIGGFRIRRTSHSAPFSERPGSNIRIDSVQHIIDAMRKYRQIVDSEPFLKMIDKD